MTDASFQYCEEHSSPQDDALYAAYRDIHLHTAVPHISSTPYMGRIINMLCKMIRPSLAVEIGVFGGYSSICIARGLENNGRLYAVEAEEEYEPLILRNLRRAAVDDRVELRIGKALEVLPTLPDGIDFAFVDADKLNYDNYYEALMPKMRKGSWMVFDNMLWYGNVVSQHSDATTAHLAALNRKIQEDSRVENVLLSLCDGVMVCRIV